MVAVGITGRRRLLGLALAVAVLATAPARADDAVPSFTNLAGESCRMQVREDVSQDPGTPPSVAINCGKAVRPSAALSLLPMPLGLPADTDRRHDAIEKALASSPSGRDAHARMACRSGKWVALAEGREIFVQPCALIDGDWPQVIAATTLGGYLASMDGLPVNLGLFEAAARRLADQPDAPFQLGGAEGVRGLLDAAFDGKPSQVGSEELDRFAKLTEAARLQNSRKDFRAAEDDYRQALLIAEKGQGTEAPGIGGILLELAMVVSNQGRYDEAAALFRRADPIIQRSPNPGDQARYFSYMALDAGNGGRFEDGLAYARQAVATWRDMAESNGVSLDQLGDGAGARSAARGELAHSLNTQAALALRAGDLSEGEAAAKEALDIIGEEKNLPPWWRPEVLVTMGRISAALGQWDAAEKSFRGALVFQQRLFGDTAPVATTLLALSSVYAEQGLNEDAIRAYDFARKILEADELARSQVVVDQVAPLLAAASALKAAHPERRAELDQKMFLALQLLSAGVADQTIAQASARLASTDPQMQQLVGGVQEANRLRDAARIALAQQTSLPDEQRGAAKEAVLLAEVNRQTALRDTQLARLEKDYPAYAALSRPQPVALDALQSRLLPREAILLFEIGRTKSFAVAVTAQGLEARPIATDQAKAGEAVRELRKAFAIRQGRVGTFDMEQAFALYGDLLGPLEPALQDVDRLVVVPGGALASLPLSLLVTQKPKGDGDFRHAAWLARRFATAEVPSIRAFVSLRDRAGKAVRASRPFLGIGNPTYLGEAGDKAKSGMAALSTECRDGGPIPAHFLQALAPLPETAGELKTVARSVGASDDALLLGAAATETALRQQPLDDVRILYFATHALLPGELSCQSEPALALSPPAAAAASKDQDGLLDASEIAGLRLNADLVVLSACNTAETGARFGGEALSGLAESFFYAGARSLVASHWQVPSAATAGLMVGMFQRLAADNALGTAEALRQSQLALMDHDDTAHPFFWAAFTVIGDGGKLASRAVTAAGQP